MDKIILLEEENNSSFTGATHLVLQSEKMIRVVVPVNLCVINSSKAAQFVGINITDQTRALRRYYSDFLGLHPGKDYPIEHAIRRESI